MIKPSSQLSCQLQAPASGQPSIISPQDILRPKPRRLTSGQQAQLARHSTAADLSRMRASPQTPGAANQQQQPLVVSPSPMANQEAPPVPPANRPNTPVNPFRRDTCGGSAPVLSHLAGTRRLSPFPSPSRNVPSGRESTGSSVRSQTPQKQLLKTIRQTPPIGRCLQPVPITQTPVTTKPQRNVNHTPAIPVQRHPIIPSMGSAYDQHHYYQPTSAKSMPALDDQCIYDVVDGQDGDDDDNNDLDDDDNYYYYYYQRQQPPYQPSPAPVAVKNAVKSPSTTDAGGSLSKSSTDGADSSHVSKKKVLSKLKSRRRNILCFSAPVSASIAPVVSEQLANDADDEQYGFGGQQLATQPAVVRHLNNKMSVMSQSTGNFVGITGKTAPVTTKRQGCYGGSSSDEMRSSGHASMSSTGTGPTTGSSSSNRSSFLSASSPVISGDGYTGGTAGPISSHQQLMSTSGGNGAGNGRHGKRLAPRSRRQKDGQNDSIFTGGEGLAGLDRVRAAIEQISLRTYGGHSTSTYSSVYSGSDNYDTAGAGRPRLLRHSSMETIGTNITSAGDDFVWVDTHSRLVELQHIPWDTTDVLRLIQEGRLRHQLSWISMDCVPRLSYLLQRPLVRIACEAQRFAKALGMCTKHEICGALRVLFGAQLADSCVKSGHRAAAIFAVSGGPDTYRQSKSSRAGLQFSVGKFHRWMCDVRMGQFVDELSAIYMTGAMENLFEEIILHCLSVTGGDCILTASLLDTCVANNSDFWGVLQPFAHLVAGRTANGALSLPAFQLNTNASLESTGSNDSKTNGQSVLKGLEQKLLTTCVGSVQQLGEIIESVSQHKVSNAQTVYRRNGQMWWSTHTWSLSSLHSLYYYMRCAQLEHNTCVAGAPVTTDDNGMQSTGGSGHRPVQQQLSQELVYERPYLVLPPLYEWMRVSAAHAYYRRCPVIDKDDVLQAARLLLPGIDCPARQLSYTNGEEWLYWRKDLDSGECGRRLKVELAFRMLSCGRPDIVQQAVQLMPNSAGINTLNDSGLTTLMCGCIGGDTRLVRLLLSDHNIACNVNVETPAPPTHKNRERYGSNGHVMAETQHWTALNYATIHGHLDIVTLLLEQGANVEGGYRYGDERATQTPLQLASSSGRLDMVKLLLTYGADPYLSTASHDSGVSPSGAACRGCPSAIAVAAMHGHQEVLRALLVQPMYGFHNSPGSRNKDVLSLEEMLAETRNCSMDSRRQPRIQLVAANQTSQLSIVSLDTTITTTSSVNNTTGAQGGSPSSDNLSNNSSNNSNSSKVIQLTKSKLRALQEAMYHAAETGCLEITLDLRNIGIPWTMHTWMQTVCTAHGMRLDAITDQLLHDFQPVWSDDSTVQFIDECLPLLFTIFRHQKHNSETSLLLAKIISSCYGRHDKNRRRPLSASFSPGSSDIRLGARIDAKYVNNKEMSDCVFKVENRLFYAHKIILVNASKRFYAMLSINTSNSSGSLNSPAGDPIVINDIRFDIFQKVMQFLYNGGFDTDTDVDQNDILELMSAASYFQLDGLLRYCSRRCCDLVCLDTLVSLYMNAIQYNSLELMQYCQRYMLENLVQLLEHDPQITQLLFASANSNSTQHLLHQKSDHLSALLFTLQQKCRDRQQQALQHRQQQNVLAKNHALR